MKTAITFLLALVCCCTVQAQFQLNIPGGKLEAVTRVEDTLYFWGEDWVWRSVDWGETLERVEPLETYPKTFTYTSGYNSSYHLYATVMESYASHQSFVRRTKTDQYPMPYYSNDVFTPKYGSRKIYGGSFDRFPTVLEDGAFVMHSHSYFSNTDTYDFYYHNVSYGLPSKRR